MAIVQYSHVILTVITNITMVYIDKSKYKITCFDYSNRDIPVSVKDWIS